MKFLHRLTTITALVVLAMVGGGAYGQPVSYNGSIQYAAGSYYFTEHTGSFYLNSGFSVAGDGYSLSVNIPLITQNTPWISFTGTGTGPLPTGGPHSGLVARNNSGAENRRGGHTINPGSSDTVRFTKTHVGDPSMTGGLTLYTTQYNRTYLKGNFSIKFPLTDANSGFGTGAWDFGTGLSWSQQVSDRITLLISGMYWQIGDMDELEFNNIVSYSAAFGYAIQPGRVAAITNIFGTTQIIENIDPPLSAGAGLSWQAAPKFSLSANVLAGLSESASDFSIGLGWNINL